VDGRHLRAVPAHRCLQPDQLCAPGACRLRPRLRRIHRSPRAVDQTII
jgi:hypothetical protein